MLSEKLKEHTKIAHLELEKSLVQKIKAIRTPADYVDLLVYFYRFFAPLESAIFSSIDTALSDVSKRRKSAWIVEDIRFFAPSHPPISASAVIPAIDNPPKALGALYVMEGSTLGGQVICKMIAKRLPSLTNQGLRFFSGYGEDTLPMWENFKKLINGENWSQEQEKEIIDAANRTFTLFKQSIC